MSIVSSGIVTIAAGVTSNNLEIIQEGILQILDEGQAQEITLTDGGQATVFSGGILYICTVSSGGTATVLNSGFAQEITVEKDGQLLLSSGGTAHHSIINSGGTMTLYEDTTATSAVVLDGGLVNVNAAAYARKPTISQGGTMRVWLNGTTDNGQVYGLLELNSGAAANRFKVQEGGKISVLSDGLALMTEVSSGGSLVLLDGAEGQMNTVYNDGSVFVSSGGTMMITTISGGCLDIKEGGQADNITVHPNGKLRVSSGGTATDIIWTPCEGIVEMEKGAEVSFASQYSGVYYGSGNKLKSNKTVISSQKLGSLETMCVMSGGTAVDTHVNSGGRMDVFSGGTATGKMTIEEDAAVSMCEGAVLDFDLTRTEDGTVTLVNDLSAIHGTPIYTLTVDGSPEEGIYSLADGAAEFSGTISVVNSEGDGLGTLTLGNTEGISGVDYTLFLSNGTLALEILSGGSSSGDPGSQDIEYESMEVTAGQILTNVILKEGGYLYVDYGGIAKKITVSSGGYLLVDSGGTATDVVWTPCEGLVTIENGAVVTFVSQYSGVYYGSDDQLLSHANAMESKTVAGGMMYVMSGGTLTDITNETERDFSVFVESGGIASNLTINTGYLYLEGGSATAITVNKGVFSIHGGSASNVFVAEEGHLTVKSGGSVDGVIVSKGNLYVSSGGTATNVDWSPGEGQVSVEVGAVVTYFSRYSGVQLSSDGRRISSAATMNGKTVNELCEMDVLTGGTAYKTTVNEGGKIVISSGGTADSTTVNSGGVLTLCSGGTATNIVASSGACLEMDVVSDTFMQGIYDGRSFELNNAVISGLVIDLSGRVKVHSGGTATDTVINSGGIDVASGGVVNNTVIGTDGAMDETAFGWVDVSGGMANNTIVNSGYLWISSGGIASNTSAYEGGCLQASSGGVFKDTTVNGGRFYIWSGGLASNVTVHHVDHDGTEDYEFGETPKQGIYIEKGGKLTGQMTFNSGAIVSASSDAIIDFDLTLLSAAATALVNDISVIQGAPLYTITVDGQLTKGTYRLSDGASGFNRTISVQDTSGESLGTLTLGKTVKISDTDFTLHLTDNVLSVVIGEAINPVIPESDVTPQTQTWKKRGEDAQYAVEYSTDNFEHVIRVMVESNMLDSFQMPAGNYQWRVKLESGEECYGEEEWIIGEPIMVEESDHNPKVVKSNEDGNKDLFFAVTNGTWENVYYAQNVGSFHDWNGTNDIVSACGKGRIQNLFFGSSDPNVLCLTDAENGDAIFVDDVYTDLPESITDHTSRLYRIQEIRAGAGADIVDMTSQQFEYIGDGLTIRGGEGDDVIWANKGNNTLFGDAGNDRVVGASGNDVIAGGIGNDRMHGGGGNDVFTFCDNWGTDSVEQLASGTVTLWFVSGDISNWNEATLTYTDGDNSVTVSGVDIEQITLRFGDDDSAQFTSLSSMGAFEVFTSQRIFEESALGILANL